MYKVIYNDIVIDLLESVRYGKYIPASKRVIATNKASANCIVASNLKDRYLLKGVPTPEGCPYLKVSVIPITNEEYYSLLEKQESPFETGIKRIKQSKISELRNICDHNIIEGVQVELTDGNLHHFAMSIEDQLNLLEIRYLMDKGQDNFIYHESGGEYREFSIQDMRLIIDATFAHKQKHLLHFNRLKSYVNSLSSINDITKVSYSSKTMTE